MCEVEGGYSGEPFILIACMAVHESHHPSPSIRMRVLSVLCLLGEVYKPNYLMYSIHIANT